MTLPGRVLLATRSAGKLRELHSMLRHTGISIITPDEAGIPEQAEEAELEVFDTFEENAEAKARWFMLRSGIPTLADDSGLEVAALGGRPGVRSKRWSGRDELSGQALDDANNARLIEELRESPDRSARYVCAAVYVDAERCIRTIGVTEGVIAQSPRGTNGFGYDPWFLSSELGLTFGEASLEAKERVSHRGRAFRALIEQLIATP